MYKTMGKTQIETDLEDILSREEEQTRGENKEDYEGEGK